METHNQQEKRISGFAGECVTPKHTHTKEKQMEKLQMSAKEQIGMEVVSIPIVQSFAKQNVMVLAKNIVPELVKESIDDLELLKQFPQGMPALQDSLDSPRYLLGNEVSIEEASSIPMDIFSVQKMKKKNLKSQNPMSSFMTSKRIFCKD